MEKYVRSNKNISSKIEDEVVMVDVELGKYFTLNSVASSIWEIVTSPMTTDEIVEELMHEYDIDKATCTSETKTFLDELVKLGLVEKVND